MKIKKGNSQEGGLKINNETLYATLIILIILMVMIFFFGWKFDEINTKLDKQDEEAVTPKYVLGLHDRIEYLQLQVIELTKQLNEKENEDE